MELIIYVVSGYDDVLRLLDGGRSPSCLSRRACASSYIYITPNSGW